MILSVLVPSAEYRNYAGARIRYGRLEPELSRFGVDLQLIDIGNYDPQRDQSDALLISKCHDGRSLVAAAAARNRGALVGVDLFDDYFSQRADSRLTRFRAWLAQLLIECDFAVCSTAEMARVVSDYQQNLPIQVVSDPAAEISIDELKALLASKLTSVTAERTLRLAWFGVGDNPHFRVGLNDVAGFSDVLRSLSHARVNVSLTVLTNSRALNADGLTSIAGLPLPTEVREWTEDAERELLAESFACFLPVNAQRFSVAKSLNRAVTALSAGCQVISTGYPLYETLSELVYRDVQKFVEDLDAGSMKLSIGRLSIYQSAMAEFASASSGASAIAELLRTLKPKPPIEAPIVLIQGHSPNGLAHKAVKAVGGLSVASPYCPPGLGFDVIFRGSPFDLRMYVSEGAATRLPPELRRRLVDSTKISDRKFWFVPLADRAPGLPVEGGLHGTALPFQIATYGRTIASIRERMEEAFGAHRTLLAESSHLPFSSDFD